MAEANMVLEGTRYLLSCFLDHSVLNSEPSTQLGNPRLIVGPSPKARVWEESCCLSCNAHEH